MAEYTVTSDGATGQVLQPGGSADIVVAFVPSAIGTRTGTLTVTDDSGGTVGTVQTEQLTGIGAVAAPDLSVTPDVEYDFPDQAQGSVSTANNFTLINNGNANLVFGAASITGANAAEFVISGDSVSNQIYAASHGGILAITFNPSGIGLRQATLNIPNNDDGVHQIDLTGNGIAAGVPVLAVAPLSLTYTGVLFGTSSTAQTLTISNTGSGTAPLVVSGITYSDARFTTTADLTTGVSIPVGSSRTFGVVYTPGVGGENITATVTITSNDSNIAGSTKVVGITASSVAPAPVASINSTTLSFGNITNGTTSGASSFTITNTGNANLVIGTMVKAGTNPTDFTVSVDGVSGQTITPGTSRNVSVTFTPSAVGARTATLSVPHNAAGSPTIITLNGTGAATVPLASVSPTTLNFTTQQGTTSSGQVVTITNTGTANLVVSSVTFTGTNPTQFALSIDNASGQTIAPGGNRTVTVVYKPITVATHTAFLSITDNAAGSPHRVSLSGIGSVPTFNFLGKTIYGLYYPSFGKTTSDFAGDSYQGWGGTAPAPLGSGNTHTYAPPNNIVADYLPADYWSGAIGYPASIYSSKDPVVLQAQCVEAINAGINVLLVSWNPPPAREDTIFPLLLTAAAAATTLTGKTLFIAPVIAPWGSASFTDPVNSTAVTTGRSNSTLWHAVNYINSTYGSHSNFYRTNRVGGNYAGSSTAGLFFIEKPEIDNSTTLTSITAAGTYWTTSTDAVHTVGSVPRGGIMIGGSGTFTAANLDQHHFDGGYNTSITPDTYDPMQYFRMWEQSFKPTAIAIPFVSPGHSSWRSQEYPPKRVGRAQGQFYDQQWNQALNGVALWDVGIRSFNGWRNGHQIEPAAVTGGDGT